MMDAVYIEVSAGVRYWEDARVNGVEDEDGSRIPCRYDRTGDYWCPIIRLSDGQFVDWPAGVEADIHYKVCDDGEYWLLDANRNRIAKWSGDYVPDEFLCHGDRGYGDYIIMRVGPDGVVRGWEPPSDFDGWECVRAEVR